MESKANLFVERLILETKEGKIKWSEITDLLDNKRIGYTQYFTKAKKGITIECTNFLHIFYDITIRRCGDDTKDKSKGVKWVLLSALIKTIKRSLKDE